MSFNTSFTLEVIADSAEAIDHKLDKVIDQLERTYRLDNPPPFDHVLVTTFEDEQEYAINGVVEISANSVNDIRDAIRHFKTEFANNPSFEFTSDQYELLSDIDIVAQIAHQSQPSNNGITPYKSEEIVQSGYMQTRKWVEVEQELGSFDANGQDLYVATFYESEKVDGFELNTPIEIYSGSDLHEVNEKAESFYNERLQGAAKITEARQRFSEKRKVSLGINTTKDVSKTKDQDNDIEL